jgi:hypothetical protein
MEELEHSTWLITESQSYTLNSSNENLRTRIARMSVEVYKVSSQKFKNDKQWELSVS